MKDDPRRYREESVLQAVRKVVDHLWEDEGEHYREREEDERRRQIFESVVLLEGWLDYQKTAPRRQHWVVSLTVMLLTAMLFFLPELLSFLK